MWSGRRMPATTRASLRLYRSWYVPVVSLPSACHSLHDLNVLMPHTKYLVVVDGTK
jgi:hypothetical protein